MSELKFRCRLFVAQAQHWFSETLPWTLAYLLPRKVALFAFVRVYATLGDCGDDYESAYKQWEAGEGR